MNFWLEMAQRVRALAASSARGWHLPGQHRQWVDPQTGLLAARGEVAETALEQCQRQALPLAVLVFEFDDLAEVQDIWGIPAHRKMLRLIGTRLRYLAGTQGLALRLTGSRFLVLLPGCCRTVAMDVVQSKLGRACSFELDSPEHELVLLPRLWALCATAETDSVKQLVLSALAEPRPADRAPGSAARPSAVVPPDAQDAKFDLPENPRATAYQPHVTTFPMSLSRVPGG